MEATKKKKKKTVVTIIPNYFSGKSFFVSSILFYCVVAIIGQSMITINNYYLFGFNLKKKITLSGDKYKYELKLHNGCNL